MDYGDPMLDGGAAYYPPEEAASFVFAPRETPPGKVQAPIVYRGPGCDLPTRARDPPAGRWYPERAGPRLLAHENGAAGGAKREGFASSPAGMPSWAPAVPASALGLVPAAPPADGASPGQLGWLLPREKMAEPPAGGLADVEAALRVATRAVHLVLLLLLAFFAAAFGGAMLARVAAPACACARAAPASAAV